MQMVHLRLKGIRALSRTENSFPVGIKDRDGDNDCEFKNEDPLPDITQCFALSKMETRKHVVQ